MTSSTFRVNDAGVKELFAEGGDVRDYAHSVGRRVVFLAKRYVGKQTRRLEQSISYRLLNGADGIIIDVEASDHIALMHHNGTRPHVITPQHGRALRFKDRGRVVYARVVLHPGTRPNPFLVTALREVIEGDRTT